MPRMGKKSAKTRAMEMAKKRANESNEERTQRLAIDRERHSQSRTQETEEKKAVRLAQARARQSTYRAIAKAENTLKDLRNLKIVKQEPFDEPFISSKNILASQFSNSNSHSLNLYNTTALGVSFNEWIIPNNPDDISSSAALADISETSSTLYTSTNATNPSYKSLKLLMNPSTSSTELKDGLSVFGEFVASKLRSFINQNLQVEAQNRISNMLFEMEMKYPTEDNLPVINSISSLKTKTSATAILPSNIVLISSN